MILNSQTPLKIWNMDKHISGKPSSVVLNHLKVNNTTIESPQDLANTLGSTVSYNSSSAFCTETFGQYGHSRKSTHKLQLGQQGRLQQAVLDPGTNKSSS
jgi:hypothetical protein